MKTTLELEVKGAISATEYETLINKYQLQDQIKCQHNYYFDTDDYALTNQSIVLRIRQKGEQYKLTSKTHTENGTIENHLYLTTEQALTMIEHGFDANIIQLNYQVKKQGMLTTYRAKMPYQNGFLFFDRSCYLAKTDYEIEYEGTSYTEAKTTFQQFLLENGIPYRQVTSKSKRALRKD